MKMTTIILIVTAVLTALIAGLFYAYSCSVVLGLGKLSDTEYLKAMQSINREILNPVFILLLLATLAYLIGVFGVTIVGNVPLNDQLDKFDIVNSTKEGIKQMRDNFENRWNFLNNVRTVFSVISILLVVCACVWNKVE